MKFYSIISPSVVNNHSEIITPNRARVIDCSVTQLQTEIDIANVISYHKNLKPITAQRHDA